MKSCWPSDTCITYCSKARMKMHWTNNSFLFLKYEFQYHSKVQNVMQIACYFHPTWSFIIHSAVYLFFYCLSSFSDWVNDNNGEFHAKKHESIKSIQQYGFCYQFRSIKFKDVQISCEHLSWDTTTFDAIFRRRKKTILLTVVIFLLQRYTTLII